jgi:hypothetical protein
MVITAHVDVFQRFAQRAEMVVFGLSLGSRPAPNAFACPPLVTGARWASRDFIFGAMTSKPSKIIG